MKFQLDNLITEYENLEQELADPAIFSDIKRLKSVNQKKKNLEKTVELYKIYKNLYANYEEAKTLVVNEKDPEMLELMKMEIAEAEEKIYAELIKADAIAKYVDAHPDMSEQDIAKYAKELKSSYNLQENLLRRLVRIQVWRKQPSRIYDLDYDIQLNAALKILNEERDFRSLLASTKTLKELQKEAELAAEKAE